MRKARYDIFISYRRTDTAEKAEHLSDLLSQWYRGRISFDRENLAGRFAGNLIERIDACRDFLLVIGRGTFNYTEADFAPDTVALYSYLAQSSLEEFKAKIDSLGTGAPLDFVRIEVGRALHRKHLNIIPVAPQSTASFRFADLRLPPDIEGIKSYEAIFYSDNHDALFKDIVPKLRKHMVSRCISGTRLFLTLLGVIISVAAIAGGALLMHCRAEQREADALKERIAADIARINRETGMNLDANFAEDITLSQLQAIASITSGMIPVEGGEFDCGAHPQADGTYTPEVCVELETPAIRRSVAAFAIGQTEVSRGQWASVTGVSDDAANPGMPVTGISFDEARDFAELLYQLTMLPFALPTEDQWEFAARGGSDSRQQYAGSDNAAEVAWYAANSGNAPHACDAAHSPVAPNALGLFDMSGNVAEWCDTPFRPYDPETVIPDSASVVIRGGAFDSPEYETAVFHRSPMLPEAKAPNVGLRLVLINTPRQ